MKEFHPSTNSEAEKLRVRLSSAIRAGYSGLREIRNNLVLHGLDKANYDYAWETVKDLGY